MHFSSLEFSVTSVQQPIFACISILSYVIRNFNKCCFLVNTIIFYLDHGDGLPNLSLHQFGLH